MTAKNALYQQAILELAKQGAGDARLASPSVRVTIDNPLCGDRVTLDLELADDTVQAVGHRVRGCLLCQAAAAAIAARAPGATPEALRAVVQQLDQAIRNGGDPDDLTGDALWQELRAFAPVRAHKSRHDCVLLPFQALDRALRPAD